MIFLAKYTVFLFGIFLIFVGVCMLFYPNKIRNLIKKAGSTQLINYLEITIRIIPAAALVIYANYSKYPDAFKLFGGFMVLTSLVLYFIPRKWHHNYAVWWANRLKNSYIYLLSPVSIFLGVIIIYSIL